MDPTTEGTARIATNPRIELRPSACFRNVIAGASRGKCLVVIGLLLVGGQAMATDNLEQGFAQLPNEAKPWVYWWFQGGYGDPQGMARDIAAMKEQGIGGVMHMQTLNASGLPVPNEPKMLSPAWDAWFGEALRLAHQSGLTLSASIVDGWSHGGGWVGKEAGAKQLVYAEAQVDGPGALAQPLPAPFTRLDLYHDVAVVAFQEKSRRPPAPLAVSANNVAGGYCGQEYWPAVHAVDHDPATFWKTGQPCSPAAPAGLDLTYARPLTITGVLIAGMPQAGPAECELQISDDGKAFRPVAPITLAPGETKRVQFAAVTARHFRLSISRAHAPDLQLAECQLLRQGDEPVLRRGIKYWDLKSANFGGGWGGWPENLYQALEEEYAGDDAGDVAAAEVVDLSAHLQADGRLDWQFPAGRWTVLRFGWTPLGQPARMGNGGGYEVDVLNSKGADLMMDTAGKQMRELSVQRAGGAPIIFHTDSWEIGADVKGQQPTWTGDFREQFQKRRGYDLLRYLPALARRVVNDRETTGRFLRDYRDTVADLLAAYYGRLQERAHQLKGGINSESGYGSYPHPHMDGLQIFGRADRPMAEFWHPYPRYSGEYLELVDVMRTAASGARIYGNRFVQAETLTSDPTAGQFTPPSQYRRTLHEAWARGLNQAVVCLYTHQPFEDKPGLLFYDIFNRHMAWWSMADGFIGYLGRCQYLLQQGDFVADAAYFVGEGASRFVPGKEHLRPTLPSGYDYDGINAEVLLTRVSVQKGHLVLPAPAAEPGERRGEGLKYRYLVLCEPQCRTLSPAVLGKIKELVKAGATVVGLPPQAAPGLTDRATAEVTVKTLVADLWGASPAAAGARRVGQGRVIWGRAMAAILSADRVKPDVEIVAGERSQDRAGLTGASWIWHAADGDNPPPCERIFRTSIDIPAGRTVAGALVSMTADNSFVLSVNGSEICRGDSFLQVVDATVAGSRLHAGRNEVLARVVNSGGAPNPAGLIGKLVIHLDNGGRTEQMTDAVSWMSSAGEDRWDAARSVGSLGGGPWGQVEADASGAARVAWIHRRRADADIYFLANPLKRPLDVTVALRATGQAVQLFDPLDGSVRDLPQKSVTKDGCTAVPLHFEPDQAVFVVVRRRSQKPEVGSQNLEKNFPTTKTMMEISGAWQVSFDAAWVKPLPPSVAPGSPEVTVTFDKLEDWSQRTEAGIKGYSGVATYRKVFALPPQASRTSDLASGRFLDLGVVKEMARVQLNGRALGVAWCPPWRVRVPAGLLKPAGNELVITVANTWNNRMCLDAALPANERLTHVGHNLQGQAAAQGLQPAGLIGPVTVQVAELVQAK